MNTIPTTQRLQALEQKILHLTKSINLASQAYNSRDFKGSILVSGSDINDSQYFAGIIPFDFNDNDAREFFNQFAATLCGQRMKLWAERDELAKELSLIDNPPNNIDF